MFLVKTYGTTKFNMTAYIAPRNGGISMDEDTQLSQSQTQAAQADRQDKQKKQFDWKEDTIIINGTPMTILFPEKE